MGKHKKILSFLGAILAASFFSFNFFAGSNIKESLMPIESSQEEESFLINLVSCCLEPINSNNLHHAPCNFIMIEDQDNNIITNSNLINHISNVISDIQQTKPPKQDIVKLKTDQEVRAFTLNYDAKFVETVILGKGITCIPGYTFSNCTKLKKIYIPNTVKRIGSNAFLNCLSLNSINLPNSIIEIEPYAFAQCEKLKDIRLPKRLKILREGILYKCYGLKSIVIPKSVNLIESNAFFICKNLMNINIKGHPQTGEDWLFGINVHID